MPAALEVDREAVKTLAIAIGVREAARKMNLPEATVQAWSARGSWFKQIEYPPTMRVATDATKPSDALSNKLHEDSQATRIALGTAARKASETFSNMTGARVIGKAAEFRQITSAAGQIGGWGDKGAGDDMPPLQILSLGGSVHVGKVEKD